MLNEIDSSEIVVYLARKKFFRKKSAVIYMSEIFRLADYLTTNDMSIRVDLSFRSFDNLSKYTYHLLNYNDNEVRIEDMNHPRIQLVMNQYRPNVRIVKMLNKIPV